MDKILCYFNKKLYTVHSKLLHVAQCLLYEPYMMFDSRCEGIKYVDNAVWSVSSFPPMCKIDS